MMDEMMEMLDRLSVEQKKDVIRLILALKESECNLELVSDS